MDIRLRLESVSTAGLLSQSCRCFETSASRVCSVCMHVHVCACVCACVCVCGVLRCPCLETSASARPCVQCVCMCVCVRARACGLFVCVYAVFMGVRAVYVW